MKFDSARLLEAIIDTAIDGIITIDHLGIIESVNPSALALFGYSAEELLGKNITVLMPEPDHSRHDGYISSYKKTGERKIIGIGREVEGRKKDGTTFPFRLSVSEVFHHERRIFTGFVHDLTREKEAENKLLQHTLELEETVRDRTKNLISLVSELEFAKAEVSSSLQKEKELNQLKSRFVSMASHEFRTPLSSVQLSASLIDRYLEKDDHSAILKHTNRIKGSVQLLNTILNDFLSLEKLEEGIVQVNTSTVDIKQLGEEITEEIQMLCKENQHIRYAHRGETVLFDIDKHLLKNTVINLVSNAVKYSGKDTTIQFVTEVKEGVLAIEVSDNGIGIPEEDQKNLFEPFFRAHNTGSIPGTGLGLNIVKRYVDLMGGEMIYSSALNQGTRFALTFNA